MLEAMNVYKRLTSKKKNDSLPTAAGATDMHRKCTLETSNVAFHPTFDLLMIHLRVECNGRFTEGLLVLLLLPEPSPSVWGLIASMRAAKHSVCH